MIKLLFVIYYKLECFIVYNKKYNISKRNNKALTNDNLVKILTDFLKKQLMLQFT